MNKKALSINAVLNTLKTVLGIIFPLITFPYISRVLGVDNVGKINFSNSIVSYFTLIAAFGVSTYAIREGARIRDDKGKFGEFSNQVFSINLITTVFSYLLLFLMLLFFRKIGEYVQLVVIQSAVIFFSTLGIDWINTIFEDFVYVTVRTLAFQMLSLVLMFTLVRNADDYYIYALITVIASAGGNFCNFFYCRKYIKVRFTLKMELKKHIPSMCLFFLTNITTIVFLNSDQTMLGLMCGDYNVGIYSLSVKIYTIIKNVFTAILTVAMPRVSYLIANGDKKDEFSLRSDILNVFMILVIPMAIGLFLLSDGIVMLAGGNKYIDSIASLRILSISVLCSAAASFMTYIVIIPQRKEKIMLYASTVSAISNVLLNLVLIRYLKQDGAAITTAIAEATVFVIEFIGAKTAFDYKKIKNNMKSILVGCLFIVLVNFVIRQVFENIYIITAIVVVVSVMVYFVVLYLLNNQLVRNIANKFLRLKR